MNWRLRKAVTLMAVGLGLALCFTRTLQAKDESRKEKIEWIGWTDDLFDRAKRENRLVLLDLQAVWCHWCHVMEEKTYSDPKVIALIRSHYLAVRVDQDSRPDLANYYEDYGWPATVVFSPNGNEIIKRSGFIPPDQMALVLQAIIDDPSPGPSAVPPPKIVLSDNALLNSDARAKLKKLDEELYDTKNGGWGFGHKYLQADSAEWALVTAAAGDKDQERKLKETLKKELKILDPAWGGFYQYSVTDWNEPHFEKIMSVQADNLRIYALAYANYHAQDYLKAVEATSRYVDRFLTSPEGAFYTSQDADLVQGQHSGPFFKLNDKKRRAKGIPRVDTHLYARENGWMAEALATAGRITGNTQLVEQAVRAVAWVQKNRGLPGGGFRHEAETSDQIYFGDSLAMARSYLALFSATADSQWLQEAKKTAAFLTANFEYIDENGKRGGFVTVKSKSKTALRYRPQRDENVAAARFFNLLNQYTGEEAFRKSAETAMRFLISPGVIDVPPSAGILLSDREMGTKPLHLTIVGSKSEPASLSLYKAAAAVPGSYNRLDWWDGEGKLPNSEVQYPKLSRPAAFLCTENRCSQPIFKAEEIRDRVLKLRRDQKS